MAEVKKTEEVKKVEETPKKKTIMEYTLNELQHKMGGIQPKDIVAKDGVTINFTWSQIIIAVNYVTNSKTLSWESTAQQAFDAMGNFLV